MLEEITALVHPPRPVVLNAWELAASALLNGTWTPYPTLLAAAGDQPWAEHLFALLEQLNFYGRADMEIRSTYDWNADHDHKLYRQSHHWFCLNCPATEAP